MKNKIIEKWQKIKDKAKDLLKNNVDDILFFTGLCILVHASFRLNCIFGEYILAFVVILASIIYAKYKSKKEKR